MAYEFSNGMTETEGENQLPGAGAKGCECLRCPKNAENGSIVVMGVKFACPLHKGS